MIPFEVTNWDQIPAMSRNGESGIATSRTKQCENIRVRLVEYSPGYKADHWCSIGHIVYCVEGEFISHLKDGTQHLITKGMSYQATDDPDNPHRSTTEIGCKLFIVDGAFLAGNRLEK